MATSLKQGLFLPGGLGLVASVPPLGPRLKGLGLCVGWPHLFLTGRIWSWWPPRLARVDLIDCFSGCATPTVWPLRLSTHPCCPLCGFTIPSLFRRPRMPPPSSEWVLCSATSTYTPIAIGLKHALVGVGPLVGSDAPASMRIWIRIGDCKEGPRLDEHYLHLVWARFIEFN